MKKMLSAALALAVALGLLAGCSGAPASSAASVSGAPAVSSSAAAGSAAPESTGTPAAERTAFRIASLKGPTTMGLVKLMDEADKGEARHDYEVTMYGAADEIAPQLIKGDIDVALVPCNLAGVLYNKTGGAVEVAAVNTLGVLYVVTTGDDITSVADLAGKTIYTTGKGTTPEYVLNYVLTQNGLTPGEDVTIEYMSEATEVLAAMQASSGYPVAMLPQPYVTTAQMQMEGLKVALDMTEEWDKVSPDSALVTGVVVARKEFVEQNEAAFNEFLEDYKASTEFVNANVDEAAALVAGYEIVPKGPSRKGAAGVQYHFHQRRGYESEGERLPEGAVRPEPRGRGRHAARRRILLWRVTNGKTESQTHWLSASGFVPGRRPASASGKS
ncbi:MAG: ABC transporter substrate-binding protein [Ruthenibacterium lactatiformans]